MLCAWSLTRIGGGGLLDCDNSSPRNFSFHGVEAQNKRRLWKPPLKIGLDARAATCKYDQPINIDNVSSCAGCPNYGPQIRPAKPFSSGRKDILPMMET